MDSGTGRIYEDITVDRVAEIEKEIGRKLVPLTDSQVKKLKPLSRRKRKFLIKKGACVCGSGKSFKKCCVKKYQ